MLAFLPLIAKDTSGDLGDTMDTGKTNGRMGRGKDGKLFLRADSSDNTKQFFMCERTLVKIAAVEGTYDKKRAKK